MTLMTKMLALAAISALSQVQCVETAQKAGLNGKKMLHLDLEVVDLSEMGQTIAATAEDLTVASSNKRLRAADDDDQKDGDDSESDDNDDDGGEVVDVIPSQIFDVKKSGFRYQVPIYFGQSKDVAMMAFDTGTSYTTLTSEMCQNCETKAYKQSSGKNHELPWNFQLNQGGQDLSLNVMTFTDKVCLNDSEDDAMCIGGFQFYPITSQEGLSKHQDGIVGLAPRQQKQKHQQHEGPLLLHELKKAEVIDHSIVAMFLSNQHAKKRSIQIGDYDTSYVQGGEANLDWFTVTVVGTEIRWQTDLTTAHYGDVRLFKHDFRFVEVDAGYAGMGLTTEDYTEVTDMLKAQLVKEEELYCDNDANRCLLKEKCESYSGQILDLKLRLSNRADFTVKGEDLLAPKSVIDHTGEYQCQLLLFDSGNVYMIGAALLKDYYTVFDVDKFRIGLGKVIDFDAPPPAEAVDEGGDEQGEEKARDKIQHDDLTNGLIFGCIAVVFITISCYICKRRRDAERNGSGSMAARRHGKAYPLIEDEDDPNHSLSMGREYPSKLSFVEGNDEEADGVESGIASADKVANNEEEIDLDSESDANSTSKDSDSVPENLKEIEKLLKNKN